MPPQTGAPGPTGWVPDPAAVERVLATLERPLFSLASPDLRGTAERDVLFWEFERKVLGALLPAHRQTVGDCVSHGWGRGVQDLLLIQAADPTRREEWEGEVATEPIYGGARVEIGGGRLGGDGAVGAWAAKWVQNYGVLLRKKYGPVDLSEYSGERARDWGRKGVPDELEPLAKQHPVRTVSLVTGAESGREALANGFPVPVCSNQGFSTVRDASGFCRPQGTWSHCMLARGTCRVKGPLGGRPAVPLQQSWGESPTGNNKVTLESGREVELPQGVFLVELDVFDRMLRGGDSFALSEFAGFPRRDLDWLML
jgi:hypothetical protein